MAYDKNFIPRIPPFLLGFLVGDVGLPTMVCALTTRGDSSLLMKPGWLTTELRASPGRKASVASVWWRVMLSGSTWPSLLCSFFLMASIKCVTKRQSWVETSMAWLTIAESLDLSRTHSSVGGAVVAIVCKVFGKEKIKGCGIYAQKPQNNEVWYQFDQVDRMPLNGFASSLTIPSPASVDKLRKT